MSTSFTPLFFEGRHGPLYGVWHAPDPGAERSHGVLFLPPLGQDYKRCHKPLQKLARDLAQQGFHVLRFDYAGSGDSANPGSWSLETWREDARDALHQLQSLSGAQDLSVFAVRLGAAAATHLGSPLAHLVLWDPVCNGAAYLEEIEELNHELLFQFRHSSRRGRKVEIPGDQIVGHVFPDTMRESLRRYELQAPASGPVGRALWIDTEATAATDGYARLKGCLAGEVRHCRVDTRCHWRSLTEIGNVIMGQPIARQVLQQLTDQAGDHADSA